MKNSYAKIELGGGVPHNLIVEGLNVGTKTIGGGQEETIEFIVPGHRAAGMEGNLKVE